MNPTNDEYVQEWVIGVFVLLVLILIIGLIMLILLIKRYKKDMEVLNGHEQIIIGWREFLHDARDVLNATKQWAKLGMMDKKEHEDVVKDITSATQELKQVVKSQTGG